MNSNTMAHDITKTAEGRRLEDARQRRSNWKRWGPYVADRAWGTVREDYSPDGDAWQYFPHDQARSKAYRWNEDGLAGICDRHQVICLALTLWNEHDPILKERLFGLSGPEGNHGEDVKEYYYYLDNTPTHSYMRFLYKYPQRAYPYAELVHEAARRTRHDPEYELLDTGVFEGNRYFDVFVEYAKVDVEDMVMRITAWNRGPDPAPLRIAPTVWLRNTWSWSASTSWPLIRHDPRWPGVVSIETEYYGTRWLYADGTPEWLFTENETNVERLYGMLRRGARYKDGIGDYIVDGRTDALNTGLSGTKAAAHYGAQVAPGGEVTLRLRLSDAPPDRLPEPSFGQGFDALIATRVREADEFYSGIIPPLSDDARDVMRQAFAGLLWSKQFYHYDVRLWLQGDPAEPPPPPERAQGRNNDWQTLFNADVLSMPDTWEYPWYAAWDLAFHAVALSLIDPDYAKEQLVLLLREWYMHPNGQLPAYEWSFSDVNPPVHAWAALRVYRIEQKRRGVADRLFLERVFHKLLLNFTWWVNRKDAEGNNIFEGGFLGLDNIGVFDRSRPLPGGVLEQSDGTSWVAMYSLNMLAIALELAADDPAYEDVASKFWEHFVYIARAMANVGGEHALWDDRDGFFYDVLYRDGEHLRLKVRSMVGLIPLFAVETLEPELLDRLPGFKRRLEWFIDNRPDLTQHVASMRAPGRGERRLLSIADRDQLERILKVMLDEREFLADNGIRSLSRYHRDHPYVLHLDGIEHRVDYEPAESTTPLFGGNSNWRGPIWFPLNFLLIEALQRFHFYYGSSFTVECPTGSGHHMSLDEVAAELSRRLTRIFLRDESGRRPVYAGNDTFQFDPHWKDLISFHEYFNGDTGEGLGASHQTGWTALVAKLLQQSGE
jgi:hypothetical protein